jgi:hypothetical protein
MTTQDNTTAKFKTFDAFAPVAYALEAIPNMDVPDAARDFAKRVTGLGEKFATDSRDAVEKATATIENTSVSSIRELGRVSRAVQTAVYQDAEALLVGLRDLAAAASPKDALQIQSDYLRGRANAAAERVKAVANYVSLATSKLEGSAS